VLLLDELLKLDEIDVGYFKCFFIKFQLISFVTFKDRMYMLDAFKNCT